MNIMTTGDFYDGGIGYGSYDYVGVVGSGVVIDAMERDDRDVLILDEGGVAEGAAEVEYGLDAGGVAVIATTALKGIAAVLSIWPLTTQALSRSVYEKLTIRVNKLRLIEFAGEVEISHMESDISTGGGAAHDDTVRVDAPLVGGGGVFSEVAHEGSAVLYRSPYGLDNTSCTLFLRGCLRIPA